MSNSKFVKNILYVALLGLAFSSCQKDLYEEKDDPIIPDKPEVEIDWSTNKTSRLNVKVDDEYSGNYYYTVEAYVENPAIVPNAKLIAGSGQKTNSKVGYTREIVIPETLETIYITVTDPFLRKRVYATDAKEGTINFQVGNNELDTKSGIIETRAADMPSVDYTYNSEECILLSGSESITFASGKKYLIEKGSTFSGDVTFPGSGQVKLYVAGTWVWSGTSSNSNRLEREVEIYVLNGGQVKNNSGNRDFSMVGTAFIAVQTGGSFGEKDSNNTFGLTITNKNGIINEGSFSAEKITMTANAGLYNSGMLSLGYLETQNTNKIVNKHTMLITHMYIKNAIIENECMIKTEKFESPANGVINVSSTGYVNATEFIASGCTLNMDHNALWDGEKATFSGQASKLIGGSTGYALFRVKEITSKSWNAVTYSGKLEIEFESHTEPTSSLKKPYTLEGNATFAEGQATVEIPASECNGNTGNINSGSGNGDNESRYEEVSTLPYTYMFEDNWPYRGDYDMNDVVMSVEIRNITDQAKTKGVRIIATLYAVGGSKALGAAFQLDGIAASAVSGAEEGQEYAVVRLFDDAHAELGAPAGKMANTYSIEYPSKEIVKEVTFNTPISGVINVNNFNLFIVLDSDFSAEKRSEVHISGFKGTSRAAVNAKSTLTYQDVETGWMWGLCIPQNTFATYPREMVAINEAYTGFSNWITGDETPDWYNNPIDGKVITYNK